MDDECLTFVTAISSWLISSDGFHHAVVFRDAFGINFSFGRDEMKEFFLKLGCSHTLWEWSYEETKGNDVIDIFCPRVVNQVSVGSLKGIMNGLLFADGGKGHVGANPEDDPRL
ncbi:hypothetical protein IV203_011570 [Nitzschia inconspicua]|uniref:Uncharacterized protein n=1 Tax=Nitzschia inconspicua TaxID=303405 RepID=A0A9K3PIS5_9STRA|nr:hypothetical protein IV203_011570 [Nitzschia inconspicua]